MDTPILDFLKSYRREGMARFHMPGHKGRGPLGCESWDLTEIRGADSLYEASGILARSEANAAELFGARRTFYSTGGSSQCVKAMLALAVGRGRGNVVLAARNVHKSFVQAAGLLDVEVEWLWPRESSSLCACPVTAEELDRALSGMETPPAAVYLTSPDYLGNTQDIRALADAAHRCGTLLLVDNAHGAYLHFLEPPLHPLDLGADLCCDSAHKTLPVLTGGACLHVAKTAPAGLEEGARQALALFGSTSPSYLTLASLDGCNRWLAEEGREKIAAVSAALARKREELSDKGWRFAGDEPLKLTLDAAASGWTGQDLADLFRAGGVEPEYADPDFVVLMASGETEGWEFERISGALAAARPSPPRRVDLPQARGERAMSIRQALLAPGETVPAAEALGRVCAAPTAACPPAIPVAVSGEIVSRAAEAVFRHYGVKKCRVVR